MNTLVRETETVALRINSVLIIRDQRNKCFPVK